MTLNGRGYIVDKNNNACTTWCMLDIFGHKRQIFNVVSHMMDLDLWLCMCIYYRKEGRRCWERKGSLNGWGAEQGRGMGCMWQEITRRDDLGDREVPVRMREVGKEKWTGQIKTTLNGTFVWKM